MRLEFEYAIGKRNKTYFQVYAQHKYSLSNGNHPSYKTGNRILVAEVTFQPHTLVCGEFRLVFVDPHQPLSSGNLRKIARRLKNFNFVMRNFHKDLYEEIIG